MAKKCPHCKKTTASTVAEMGLLFGFRIHRGKTKVQSWCRQCRKFRPMSGVPADRATLVEWYMKRFPGDKTGHKRSEKFMSDRLRGIYK